TVEQMHNGQAEKSWHFDALSLNTRAVDAINTEVKGLDELGQAIATGLTGSQHVLLRVTAFVRQGAGQEVFPSQELILDKERTGKSKTLYHVDGVAAIHSQKIGNAIRTIDTWYEVAEELGPIAVEPYGSVTTQGKAHRQPKQKRDFYTLLDNWLLKDQAPPAEQQHFVMAVLIRGGVFGDAN
ncbi:MAG: type I-F CRISPR-associated protein Csy3, partial [Burkholderiales bacterium]